MRKYLTTVFVFFFFVSVGYGAHDTLKVKISDSVVLTKEQLAPKENVHIYFRDRVQNNYFKDVLPIITLLLGIFLNRGWDWFDKRRQTKKHGERWKTELELLALPITNQVSFLKEFLEEHKKETFKIPDITIQLSLKCTAFDTLDKSELIKYVENFKDKDYKVAIDVASRVDTVIGALKNNYQILNDRFQDYLSGVSTYTLELNEGLQEIMQNLAKYGVELERNGDNLDDPNYLALLKLFSDEILPYREQANYDVIKIDSNFLIPFFSITSHLRLDMRIIPLVEAGRKIHISVQKLKNEKFYICNYFNSLFKYICTNKYRK